MVRCVSIQSRGWGPIAGVDEGLNSIFPEGGREFGLNQKSSGTSSNFFISMLCYTILMGFIGFSVLPTNSLIGTELIEFLTNIFTSLVISGHLDTLSNFVLSICLKLLECSRSLRLFP